MTQLTRNLLHQARAYQQYGDLASAIKCASDALAIRPNCSTIHALLGSLYEQKGEKQAARLHFRKALTVTPSVEEEECLLPVVPMQESALVRPIASGWMLPVLIGCIVFSGLAALFTLWPGNQRAERGSIVIRFMPPRQQTPPPSFTEVNLGKEMPVKSVAAEPPVVDENKHRQPKAVAGSNKVEDPTPLPLETAPTVVEKPAVLGPSATNSVPISPKPTEAHADQAFFNGDHERAAATYERVLDRQETPNPRTHQRLAQCYQRLGNRQKARYHIEQAIEGYTILLSDDAGNAMTRQELESCRTILQALETRQD